MSKKRSLSAIKKAANALLTIRDVSDMSALIKIPRHQIVLSAEVPRYNIFAIKKRSGKERWIEEPLYPLRQVLDSLSYHFSSLYWLVKTEAAYGYILTVKREPKPRNILTNAQKHLGCNYLLNLDLKDFFHQISFEKTFQIFTNPPFNFEKEIAILLTRLSTFKERLPMGAATSPSLSNFATIELDKQLGDYASWSGTTYTRYVDDLTFSSPNHIGSKTEQEITSIINKFGFQVNHNKVRRYGETQTKEVTGLVLKNNQVEVPNEFKQTLSKEINHLQSLLEVTSDFSKQPKWVKKYHQKVQGKLNFIRKIYGNESNFFQKVEKAYDKAVEPTYEFESASWLNFPHYQF